MTNKRTFSVWIIGSLIAASGVTLLSLTFLPQNHNPPIVQNSQDSSLSSRVEKTVLSQNQTPETADSAPSPSVLLPELPPQSLADINTDSSHHDDLATELITPTLERFKDVNELLDNIDDPDVQKFIASLPQDAQKSIQMHALQHSVSKRIDSIEADSLNPVDLQSLFDDIDTLAQNLVIMPEEARHLKIYLTARIKS